MATATKNNKANVSAAKGVEGGYAFHAPAGTTLPTDFSTTLGDAFKCMGYVGEDGIVFSDEPDSEDFKDMNGDAVDVSRSGYGSKLTIKLMEHRMGPLAVAYGDDNVTDSGGVLKVLNTGELPEHGVWVFELLLKNKRRCRIVIPDSVCTEVGDLTALSSKIFARELTCTNYKDEELGAYWVEYAESTETSAS